MKRPKARLVLVSALVVGIATTSVLTALFVVRPQPTALARAAIGDCLTPDEREPGQWIPSKCLTPDGFDRGAYRVEQRFPTSREKAQCRGYGELSWKAILVDDREGRPGVVCLSRVYKEPVAQALVGQCVKYTGTPPDSRPRVATCRPGAFEVFARLYRGSSTMDCKTEAPGTDWEEAIAAFSRSNDYALDLMLCLKYLYPDDGHKVKRGDCIQVDNAGKSEIVTKASCQAANAVVVTRLGPNENRATCKKDYNARSTGLEGGPPIKGKPWLLGVAYTVCYRYKTDAVKNSGG